MSTMRKRKYTHEQLVESVKTSTSYRQVMSKLGLVEAGGNYASIKNTIIKHHLDTTHFTGKGWNIGLKFKPNPPALTTNLLVADSAYSSHKLRLRLLNEGYFEHKCYSCFLTEWMKQPITLELEHIDGNHKNNRIENLTLLCPNCHALTSTWRRRKPVMEKGVEPSSP